MSLSTPTTGAPPEEERTDRGVRSGFVGAFIRNVRRGSSASPLGKVAVSGLVVVLTAGSVVGLGLLLNKPAKLEAAGRTSASASASASNPAVAPSGESRRSPAGQPAGAIPGGTGPQVPRPGTVALGAPVAGGAGTVAGGAGTVTGGGTAPRAGAAAAGGGSTGQGSSSVGSSTQRSTARTVRFQATAGLGCDSEGAGYGEYGWYENGDAGWWRLAYGSYTGEGCSGEFTDMPMSGSDRDTDGQAMMWGFAPGRAPLTCELSLFVPTSSSSRDVAAARAHFAVVHGNRPSDATYTNPSGDRFVNQGANNNRWVGLGTYPVSDGQIGVKLTNRGTTSGYPMTYPHLAGGAVKIVCWDR
jgi:hypothetical protein